jgi:hypothetical protein
MSARRTLGAVLLVGVVLLAGCSGGGGGGGGDGNAGSADWCQQGQSYSYANPQTGEQASMNIQGIVDHNGRQTCKATWESSSSDGSIARMELFYTEDNGYTHVIMYDEDGNQLYEIESTSTA